MTSILGCALVAIACIFRFIHLDSDPKFEFWEGYVTDEGRWTGASRDLALYGQTFLDRLSRLHLVLAPGFQAVNYVIFKLAGVSFYSARLWSALSGSAILIVSFLVLRKHASGLPLCLGLGILGFETLMLGTSRIAIPEAAALLFTLLSFLTILTWKNGVVAAVASGLLLAVAVAMKGTTLLVAPIFAVIVACSGQQQSRSWRLRRCAGFLLGLLVPAACGLLLAISTGVVTAETLPVIASTLWKFLGLADPKTAVSRLLEPDRRNVNLLLPGVWLCSWVWMHRTQYRGTPQGDLYRLSGIWSLAALVIWSSLSYSPQRYLGHVIAPLVIYLIAGLTLWQRLGPAHVAQRIDEASKGPGIACAAWLVLPTAAILSIGALDFAGSIWIQSTAIRYKLYAVAVAVCMLVVLVRTRPQINAAPFLVFPVATVIAWVAADEILQNFLYGTKTKLLLPTVDLVIVSSVAWWCFARRNSAAGLISDLRVKTLLGILLLVGLLAESSPELIRPTYSIRDASRRIAEVFPEGSSVRTVIAASLLLETRIRYREELPAGESDVGILTVYKRPNIPDGFALIARYPLVLHPLFCTSKGLESDSCDFDVYVYRNIHAELHPQGTPR
ncbi:MAG: ArnT family glycosyltransferase [Burkholderiales bacterium]